MCSVRYQRVPQPCALIGCLVSEWSSSVVRVCDVLACPSNCVLSSNAGWPPVWSVLFWTFKNSYTTEGRELKGIQISWTTLLHILFLLVEKFLKPNLASRTQAGHRVRSTTGPSPGESFHSAQFNFYSNPKTNSYPLKKHVIVKVCRWIISGWVFPPPVGSTSLAGLSIRDDTNHVKVSWAMGISVCFDQSNDIVSNQADNPVFPVPLLVPLSPNILLLLF